MHTVQWDLGANLSPFPAQSLINVTGGAGVRPVFIFMQILNYLIKSVTRLPFPGGRGPVGRGEEISPCII